MCVVRILGRRGAPFVERVDERVPSLGRGFRPRVAGVSGNLPLSPVPVEQGVQGFAQRLQGLLPAFPDGVDLRVAGNGLERDVRHTLVDEAVSDVAMRGGFGRRDPGECGLLSLALGAVGQQVPRIAGAHDAGARKCQGDAGGVDGDPAPAPLLCDVGAGPGAAGGIEHQVGRISGHQDAPLDHFGIRLNNVYLAVSERARACIHPQV